MQNYFSKDELRDLCDKGITFFSYDGVVISKDAKIGKGTVIYPGTIIKENCVVGENCTLGPNSLIENSTVGDSTVLNSTQVYSSTVGSSVQIGPFCHIRPNSVIKDGAKLGNFVEIKNSVIGEKTSVSHLTYVGDSDIGSRVNFGCGCVTVNYDGINKNRCTVGDNAFIGCNTNLVAPVSIGDNAYIAAGSTITDNINDDALAIARARQVNKEGYAVGRFPKKK